MTRYSIVHPRGSALATIVRCECPKPPSCDRAICAVATASASVTSAATTRLPSFTRVDAAVFYEITPSVHVQLNVENVMDETYFADAHNNFNISPGAPRNARLTLMTRF